MMKRLTWFVGGVAAGAFGVSRAKRKVISVANDLSPVRVARRTTDRVRRRGHDVVEAVGEGRRAMRAKELELKARLDGRASSLADELGDEDAVLVDGRAVEPGQVIVLRQVRDDERTRRNPVSPASATRRPRRPA